MFMTDAQMLQNLLAVYESIITGKDRGTSLSSMKEVIAALRRRLAWEETK